MDELRELPIEGVLPPKLRLDALKLLRLVLRLLLPSERLLLPSERLLLPSDWLPPRL